MPHLSSEDGLGWAGPFHLASLAFDAGHRAKREAPLEEPCTHPLHPQGIREARGHLPAMTCRGLVRKCRRKSSRQQATSWAVTKAHDHDEEPQDWAGAACSHPDTWRVPLLHHHEPKRDNLPDYPWPGSPPEATRQLFRWRPCGRQGSQGAWGWSPGGSLPLHSREMEKTQARKLAVRSKK